MAKRKAHPTGGRGIGPVMPSGTRRTPSAGMMGVFTNTDHGTALDDNRRPDVVHHQRMIHASETFQALRAHWYAQARAYDGSGY